MLLKTTGTIFYLCQRRLSQVPRHSTARSIMMTSSVIVLGERTAWGSPASAPNLRASSPAPPSARAALLAEGAHGSPSKSTIALYTLRACSEAQNYGLGLKELRRSWDTYGGEREYHVADGLPYYEFQCLKHLFRVLLAAPGAERLAYGAPTLTEDWLQTLPHHFPGGANDGEPEPLLEYGVIIFAVLGDELTYAVTDCDAALASVA
ncbi:hypothetical protein DFH09DRAFT_1316471 [Mycena vulgaris]|nr:hypothetical protein DFH09DRAFT_1316471 [Mycena vulgaris]